MSWPPAHALQPSSHSKRLVVRHPLRVGSGQHAESLDEQMLSRGPLGYLHHRLTTDGGLTSTDGEDGLWSAVRQVYLMASGHQSFDEGHSFGVELMLKHQLGIKRLVHVSSPTQEHLFSCKRVSALKSSQSRTGDMWPRPG